ncbi:hypothetical protein F4779DRAFT_80948 [Xylariaceae sp. FL0662B]|nr:hypothetical protein F4779DRAFT_80948 [Xylariaceae sp. FL0662B]
MDTQTSLFQLLFFETKLGVYTPTSQRLLPITFELLGHSYLGGNMHRNHDLEPLKHAAISPQTPRHQIKRSITELTSPIKLPRYHHLHHFHQRKDRDRDDRPPLSTGPTPHISQGSLELPHSEGATPYTNVDSGLRTSMSNPGADDAVSAVATATLQPHSIDDEERLRVEREKAISRIAGLRKSLADLNTFSIATTRRLDDTYYAVLEKLSTLQSTVTALKELAGMSQEVNESFKAESQGLVKDIDSQVNSFGQFDGQQKRIEELQGRIYAGRDKVQALSQRVDVVRERIEGWERADREWQERTRKRLKLTWIIMSLVALSLMLVFVGAQYASSSENMSPVADLAPGNHNGKSPIDDLVGNQSISTADVTGEVREALSRRRGGESADGEVLRAFDEL